MNRKIDLISKNRENTPFYDFKDIKKLCKDPNNEYFGKCVPYDELENYETNCIPIAHFYDDNNKLQVVFSRDPSHALGIGCTGAGKTTIIKNDFAFLKSKVSGFSSPISFLQAQQKPFCFSYIYVLKFLSIL